MVDLSGVSPEEIEQGQKVYDQLNGLPDDAEPSPEEPIFKDLINNKVVSDEEDNVTT